MQRLRRALRALVPFLLSAVPISAALRAADVSLGVSSIPDGRKITFVAGGTFHVGNEEPGSFDDFQVDSSSGSGDIVGQTGDLDGEFLVGTITTTTVGDTVFEFADVSGSGALVLRDRDGDSLTAEVEWQNISTLSNSISINTRAEANMRNASYDGASEDLQALAAASSVIIQLAASAEDDRVLSQLVAEGGSTGSFSGAITAVSCDGRIGDFVWIDNDCDGRQDDDEIGVPDVDVVLRDADGEVVGATTTDAAGRYEFGGVCPGGYMVEADLGALSMGLAPTASGVGDPDGDSNTSPAPVEISEGDTPDPTSTSDDSIDFGFKAVGSISDRVWLDLDCDGTDDAGEPGINGVRVELRTALGDTVIASTETNGDGNYSFDGLDSGVCQPEGGYAVAVDLSSPALDGLAPGFDLDGSEDAQVVVSLTAGLRRTDVDFAFRPAAGTGAGSIGDRVWLDLDCDGLQDDGEPGLNGVRIALRSLTTRDPISITESSGDGNYSFAGLDAGGCPPAASFRVVVDLSSPPLAGLEPSFDLDGGSDAETVVDLGADSRRTDVDFGFRRASASGTGSIGGRVWLDIDCDGVQDDDEPGINGVRVDLRELTSTELLASIETSGDGNYAFEGLNAGGCTPQDRFLVVVDLSSAALSGLMPGFDLDGGEDAQAVVDFAAGAQRFDVDFAFRDGAAPGEGSIGGRLWLDLDCDGVEETGEPGINGVRIELRTPAANEPIASTETSGDGNFDFEGLATGGCQEQAVFVVAVDPSSPALAGLVPGFDLDGGADFRAQIDLTGGAQRSNVDFGFRNAAVAGDGSVGDRVWLDLDCDRIQDDGEPGINGVRIELRSLTTTEPLATTETSGDGNYRFDGLAGGGCQPQGGFIIVIDPSSPALANLSPTFDLDGGGDLRTRVDLAGAEQRSDVDFGFGLCPLGELPCPVFDYLGTALRLAGLRLMGRPAIPPSGEDCRVGNLRLDTRGAMFRIRRLTKPPRAERGERRRR
jgi:hypothetical protein